MKGRVVKSTGSWYLVKDETGIFTECRLKGKFRLDKAKLTNPVSVGDYVTIELEENNNTAVISEIQARENYISRQSPRKKHARHIIAANIDQLFLVATVTKPRTSTGFIDRFLLTAEAYHIPAYIIFNKQDVLTEKELAKQTEMKDMYESVGYNTLLISAISGNIDELMQAMKGKTTLIAGHSGVGKSTVINRIIPELELKTAEISTQTNKGTHATTYAEMYELPTEGFIIDTPGIKEFGVLDIEPAEVSHYYIEMAKYLGNCKFNDCLHVNEPDCAVTQAFEEGKIHLERYKNYLNILEDPNGSKR